MAFNINADIVDIRSDIPKSTDNFLVDSNVWYWLGYTKASINALAHQITHYPHYLNQAVVTGSGLYKSALSFAELAHIIERSEHEIFNASQGMTISKKDFRHNYPTERANVLLEIEHAWVLADALTGGRTIDVHLNNALVNLSLQHIKVAGLDGYDSFMVESLLQAGITQVITDDGDFGRVGGITVFTANNNLIREARKQKKLILSR